MIKRRLLLRKAYIGLCICLGLLPIFVYRSIQSSPSTMSPLPTPGGKIIKNNMISAFITGLHSTGGRLEFRYLQSTTSEQWDHLTAERPLIIDSNEGELIQSFPVVNGMWAVSNLDLPPGLYQLRPQGDEYVTGFMNYVFWVPPDTQWFYLNLSIPLLHRDDLRQQLGTPVCKEKPIRGQTNFQGYFQGNFVILSSPLGQSTAPHTPTPTATALAKSPLLMPQSTPTHTSDELPAGGCYANQFYNWPIWENMFWGSVKTLSPNKAAVLIIYGIPISASEHTLMYGVPTESTITNTLKTYFPYPFVLETGLVTKTVEVHSEWSQVMQLPVVNGKWMFVNDGLAIGRYFVTAKVMQNLGTIQAKPSGYLFYVSGDKTGGGQTGFDFAIQ